MDDNHTTERDEILRSRQYFLAELYDGIMATKQASDVLKRPLELKFYEDLYGKLYDAHTYINEKPAEGLQSWDDVMDQLMGRVETIIANTGAKK